jgi:3-hydroxyisobutyrate dehydrogenase-like beta-hydroxyacid dehydrogenase
MQIAFLGLGKMGSAIAARVLAAGYPLHVWNRSPGKAEPLAGLGAQAALSPAAAVAEADVVMTSLLDDASLTTLFDPSAPVLAAMKPGAIHLCLTTISPGCADALAALHAAHGTAFVSGPVVGRPDAAAAGTLVVLLSGDGTSIAAVEPLCRAFAQRVVPIPGSAGAANKQKLCINFFAIASIEAMSECFTLVDKLGASRSFTAAFLAQAYALPALKGYVERLNTRDVDGSNGFTMAAGRKDIGLMLDAARDAGCPLELGEIIAAKMQAALDQGMATDDWSAIQEIGRQRAGLEPAGSAVVGNS